jgi:catechol 2,3-dioxygenase-like lactoylglutathione lyase family enzyme
MRTRVLCIAAVVIAAGFVARPAGVQSTGQTSDAPSMSHVGIAVRDIAAAIEIIAALTGAEKPAIQSPEGRSQPGIDRTARVRLNNIVLELLQPAADAPSAVQARGIGVQHLGIEIGPGASVTDRVNRLVQLGGNVVASDPDRAFVNLAPKLGPLLEISSPTLRDRLYPATPAPRLDAASPFARVPCVTHVGIAVRDIEQARQTYSEFLGMAPPAIGSFEAATGAARMTFFKLRNISIELLQQAPGVKGAYSDFLGANAQRVHHIGLHLRGRNASYRTVQEQIAWIERHGGTIAVNAGFFLYVDVGLGVHIEALAEESINSVYPCQ